MTKKSNRAGCFALAVHLGLLVFTGTLILLQVPAWPILLLPHGVLLVFLFTTLHECVHNTAFATDKLNQWVARFCSLVLCIPTEWFKHFHWAHHRHTQDRARDPELATAKPTSISQYILHISGFPLWWSSIKTLLRNACGACDDEFIPSKSQRLIQLEAVVMLSLYAALLLLCSVFSWAGLVWIWLVPIVLGQPFLRLYLLAEHGRCAFVANMFENTRTTFTQRFVLRLAWNMPFHAEHHAYPAVPFYKLPQLHELTRKHLHVTAAGYASFHKRYVNEVLS